MTRRRQLIILGLFLAGGFGVFSTILTSYFLSDDFVQIGKVLNGDFSVVWGKEHGGFFRPLFILSYIVDDGIWGARPLGFHITNVAFHSVNAFLVFLLSFRLLEHLESSAGHRHTISLIAGALFLFHPSHTEAVSWISGRADLIATLFSLLSLLMFLSYRRNQRRFWLAGSLICFVLALLAKESAVCVPLIILAIELLAKRRDQNRLRRPLQLSALFSMILLIFLAVRYAFLGSFVGGYGSGQHLNFGLPWLRDRLLEASVRSILPALPEQLSRFLFKPLQSKVFILSSLICLGLTAVIIVLRRRWLAAAERREQNRTLLLLGSLLLLSLLPVINLRLNLYESAGERFLYLPTVFSCLLITYLAAVLVRRPALWISILICLMGFYVISIFRTNQLWREASALSQRIVEELPRSSERDRVVILNAPDNVRGVPVFHNGLPEALRYFQARGSHIEILSFQRLQTVSDRIAVNRQDLTLTMEMLDQKGELLRVNTVECLDLISQSRTSLNLQMKPCLIQSDLFFFDQGRMLKLTHQ